MEVTIVIPDSLMVSYFQLTSKEEVSVNTLRSTLNSLLEEEVDIDYLRSTLKKLLKEEVDAEYVKDILCRVLNEKLVYGGISSYSIEVMCAHLIKPVDSRAMWWVTVSVPKSLIVFFKELRSEKEVTLEYARDVLNQLFVEKFEQEGISLALTCLIK